MGFGTLTAPAWEKFLCATLLEEVGPFGQLVSAGILGTNRVDSLHGPGGMKKGLINADIGRNESSTFAHDKFRRLDVTIYYPK